MSAIRRRVVVAGRVQGVYFRDTCRRLALAEGVAGWVRNLPDGRVEAVFEGPRESVGRLVGWSRQGPPEAMVTAVEVSEQEPVRRESGFHVLPTPWGSQQV
jgi:acylphosphatase